MDNHSIVDINNKARLRFTHDCYLLTNRITTQQASNQRLSDHLQTLIDKKLALIERVKDLLAT